MPPHLSSRFPITLALASAYVFIAYAAGVSSPLASRFPVFAPAFLVGIPFATGYMLLSAVRDPSRTAAIVHPWDPFGVVLLAGWLVRWDGASAILLSLPWIAVFASLGGLTAAWFQRSRHRASSAALVALLPFLIVPIATRPTKTLAREIEVSESMLVGAPPHVVWDFVVSADTIRANERRFSLYRLSGLPAPVAATVDHPRTGALRIARFERNQSFAQRVTEWRDQERLDLQISPNVAQFPPSSIESAAAIGGRFIDVTRSSYDLARQDGGTRVTLTTRYRTSTLLNWYAVPVARIVARSLERDILALIRRRAELAVREGTLYLTADMRELESAMSRQGGAPQGYAPVMGVSMIVSGQGTLDSITDYFLPKLKHAEELDAWLEDALRTARARARTTAWSTVAPVDASQPDSAQAMRFEYEDRNGRCIAVTATARSRHYMRLRIGERHLTRCDSYAMLPNDDRTESASTGLGTSGRASAIYTLVGDYPARVDVRNDSVIVTVRNASLIATVLADRHPPVDSITASLARPTGYVFNPWRPGRASNAFILKRLRGTDRPDIPETARFAIPRGTVHIANRRLLFTHHVTMRPSSTWPWTYGWFYARGTEGMFTSR